MRVLAVGGATLDIVNSVAAYPEEDDELRALSHHR
ncbi:MAG: ketohexokinase, partial [gamma proteobacterium symbiont of Ctena orbiculata]